MHAARSAKNQPTATASGTMAPACPVTTTHATPNIVNSDPATLPNDIDTLKAALIVARAEVAAALAERSANQALIAHLKLEIAKLKRDKFGPRSEHTSRLLDQLELQLVELEAAATEDELAAALAAQPPEALRATRRLLRGDPVAALARIDAEADIFGAQLKSAEFRTAVQAFLAKAKSR